METYQCVMLATVVTGSITAFVVKLWDTYQMEGKYRTNDAAEACMRARKESEERIFVVLEKISKRLTLGNLVMSDIANGKGLQEKILQYEKALGIKLADVLEN